MIFVSALEDRSVLNRLTGPLSWLAICSAPGIAWVTQRTGVDDFAAAAQKVLVGVTRRLKVDRKLLSAQPKEPDADTAWLYCRGKILTLSSAQHE